jgi:hypothetical protein
MKAEKKDLIFLFCQLNRFINGIGFYLRKKKIKRERRLEEEREIENIDLQRKGKHPSWLVMHL